MKTSDKPQHQAFHIEGVRHIAPNEALVSIQQGSAIMIDVREAYEIDKEGIVMENILYHPMSEIVQRLPFIPQDLDIVLVCPVGVRSTKVANLMSRQGYPSVANLDGGFVFWKAEGLPFRSDIPLKRDCGCSCSVPNEKDSSGSCC